MNTRMNLSQLNINLIDNEQEKERWNQIIKKHHYLGSHRLVGESLRYVATYHNQWVALLGWTGPSFKLADRDSWIGWCDKHKEQRIKYLANNSRLFILPEFQVKNLASKVLTLNLQRLSNDWVKKYNHPIILVETFVDPSLYAGTCYRATGFIEIGKTKGYGVSAGNYYYHGKEKLILVKPLHKKARKLLTSPFLNPILEQGSRVEPLTNISRLNVFGENGLIEQLNDVNEWRSVHGKRHEKGIIFSLVVCAILSGHGDSYRKISFWINDLPWEVASNFGCRYISSFRTPSEPTIRRSLQGTNGEELCQKVASWLKKHGKQRLISIVCQKIHYLCRIKINEKEFISAIMGGELS